MRVTVGDWPEIEVLVRLLLELTIYILCGSL